jgi:hypothetical protein
MTVMKHQVATCARRKRRVNNDLWTKRKYIVVQEKTTDDFIATSDSGLFHRPEKNAHVATLLRIFCTREARPDLLKCFQS